MLTDPPGEAPYSAAMNPTPTAWMWRAAAALLLVAGAARAADTAAPPKLPETPAATLHDFDAQHGRWRTQVHRLLKPLEGSQEWADYDGTTTVHALLDGRANVADLDVSGPRGRIQGLSVRLLNGSSKRWTIQYTSAAAGELDAPLSGGFAGGAHGVFYGNDTFRGKPIVVRFVVDVVDPRHVHFEQAFSADGGATWEMNWIADDTRL
jgi:hypothetical protein